jgi:hypothetical protein
MGRFSSFYRQTRPTRESKVVSLSLSYSLKLWNILEPISRQRPWHLLTLVPGWSRNRWRAWYWNQVNPVYFQGNCSEFEMSSSLISSNRVNLSHTSALSSHLSSISVIGFSIPSRICNAKYFQFMTLVGLRLAAPCICMDLIPNPGLVISAERQKEARKVDKHTDRSGLGMGMLRKPN